MFRLSPRLKSWESPTGSSRGRVPSALADAFAWGLRRVPSGYDPGCASQRVQPGHTGRPTRTRRAWFQRPLLSRHRERRGASFERLRRPEYRLGPPRSGIRPTGDSHSRPGPGSVRVRLSCPAGCGPEASVGVEDPLPQPENAATSRDGRVERTDSVQTAHPVTGRWVASTLPASSHGLSRGRSPRTTAI